MFNISEIKTEIPDLGRRSYAFVTTLASGGDSMMESPFVSYANSAGLPEKVVNTTVAYFSGMNYFTVGCDCGKPDCKYLNIKDGEWYQLGLRELECCSETFTYIGQDINGLRVSLNI